MLAGLVVVVLVEPPDQLLEDRAHGVVVEAGMPERAVQLTHFVGAEVDRRVEELFDQGAEGIGLGEPRDLVAELELLQDVLDVRREAVEVVNEVGPQLLRVGSGPKVTQGEGRGVIEVLPGLITQRLVLVPDACLIESRLHPHDRGLAGLQGRVQPAQHRHRQDDVAVFAPGIEVAQYVIGDVPDETDEPAQLIVLHQGPL